MIKHISEIKNNNSGMTMVEVLMGFLILSIILGAVITVISFSSNMYFRSADEKRKQTTLMEESYKSSATAGAGTSCAVTANIDGTETEINLEGVTRKLVSDNTYVFSYSKP